MQPYYQDNLTTLYHGDCLEIMAGLEAQSFDAVISDTPFGLTNNPWDAAIPFTPMWECIRRLSKPCAAIALFGSQPFTSSLVLSNVLWFRHEWIWIKNRGSNFLNTTREPMKEHESIILFSEGGWTYNMQPQQRNVNAASMKRLEYPMHLGGASDNYGPYKKSVRQLDPQNRVPSSWQCFAKERGLHPNQKPLALMEYLIKTYTNEGDTVLDFTCGSGTTLRAAKNLKRRAVGIEKELEYCEVTVKRLAPAFEAALVDSGATLEDLPMFAV